MLAAKKGYIKLNTCLAEETEKQKNGLNIYLYKLIHNLKIKSLLGKPTAQISVIALQLIQFMGYMESAYFNHRPYPQVTAALYLRIGLNAFNLDFADNMQPATWFILLLLTNIAILAIVALLVRVAVKEISKYKKQRNLDILAGL